MKTFCEFLSDVALLNRLWLIETYFSFDPAQYNQLFDNELGKLSVSSPEHRAAIERMRGFNWIGYIAKSVRNAGYRDQREVQERTHDLVVKLLTGGLFRDYDERQTGSIDLRFKRSLANAIKNMVALDQNRQRLIPTVPIDQESGVRGSLARDDDEGLIAGFRKLVRDRLGELGTAVLDARLQGQEVKSLVGREDLGRPGRFVIKRVVGQVKALAREYAEQLGDPAFLRDIERAMRKESATVAKRLAAVKHGQ
jgi:hypothetical protein